MNWSLATITAPAVEPVSLDEAKQYARIDAADDNPLVQALIVAARQHCEDYISKTIITTTLELTLDEWPADGMIAVPRPPLQSVSSIKYTDSDGVEHAVSASDYVVSAETTRARVYLKNIPTATLQEIGAIKIRYVAGYASVDAVPQKIKQAIKLLISQWDKNREASISGTITTEVQFTLRALLDSERLVAL